MNRLIERGGQFQREDTVSFHFSELNLLLSGTRQSKSTKFSIHFVIVWGCFTIFFCFFQLRPETELKDTTLCKFLSLTTSPLLLLVHAKLMCRLFLHKIVSPEMVVTKSGGVVTKRWIFRLKFSVFYSHPDSKSRFNYIFNFPYLSDATEAAPLSSTCLRMKKIKNKRAFCSQFTSFPFRLFPCKAEET